MEQSVLIPEERKRVLIGKGGKTLTEIEKLTGCRIEVGEAVSISGEGIEVLRARDMVKAIGRGFNPETAMLLADEDYVLDVISLSGENEKTVRRLMARVIGRKGSTRRIIEHDTGCHLSVYGKTVSIIGPSGRIESASKAVEQLLSGRSHGYVYKRLKESRML